MTVHFDKSLGLGLARPRPRLLVSRPRPRPRPLVSRPRPRPRLLKTNSSALETKTEVSRTTRLLKSGGY